MKSKQVGVIGGGQLAWMMAEIAPRLDLELIVQTPKQDDPAVICTKDVVLAGVDDAIATKELASRCHWITFENEFIDLDALRSLAQQGVCFRPSLDALAPLLDKYEQRSYLSSIGLPVPQFRSLSEIKDLETITEFPIVLKARRHGYDGQGTFILQDKAELTAIWNKFQCPPMLLEEFVPFTKELAVMVARNAAGKIIVYPVVETHQKNQVCRWVIAPAAISVKVKQEIEQIARTLVDELQVVGIFGIELFLTPQETILVNEIAPRTHNSGHYTLDACDISQFEMQLRTVADLEIATPQFKTPGAVMVNLLGYENSNSDYQAKRDRLADLPQTFVHWYGKSESRLGRKLGHVTVLLKEEELAQATAIAQKIESIWYE
ncbi:phosphoribosylaminoimidazole carboxylase, PurK protein [Xenococcus sp. PCC 7305]|uniref:5-(carboxyamino)imidazole ribonucleotide synthase n=1 Tax=Xenococcus sp. PCC 7305 TaxID=102125 RepID=UPI0002ACDF26|nr:5-(carboxyamino)imidazole ribonucleotide synthase [Xenococcus sp. PCC 7305]ELS01227.1 phosphoribosylaminoimidazole carboxylase, PurK protein [Xenococcus sp. PCC 7305]